MTLTELRGIGQITASTILHLYDKEQYPILSEPALWSVGLEKKNHVSLLAEIYCVLPEYCEPKRGRDADTG